MQDSDQLKAEQAKSTIQVFLNQFPPDIYTKIVLEEFFKELLKNGKPIPLPSTNGQPGH
jgi:hypothetical protein